MSYLKVVVGTVIVVAIAVFFAVLSLQIAYGQTTEIPIVGTFHGVDGELFPVGELRAVPGEECVAVVGTTNNESEHDGTNFVIIHGEPPFTDAVILDIESAAFGVGSASFTAASEILSFFIQVGPDEVASVDFLLEITCNPPTTTTEPPESGSTTTVPIVTTTTLPPVTTTTEPPPINGVDTGGGACADGACDGSLMFRS